MPQGDFMNHPVIWIMVVLIFAGIFASVGFMLMSEVDEEMAMNESGTWYPSYQDVVSGIGSGFSLYSLIPLMTIISVVIALLVGAFYFKTKAD